MTASLLKRQLDLYVQTADEPWKRDHIEAMICCDVEEAIAFGLSILGRVQTQRNCQEAIEVTEGKCRFVMRWYETSLKVLEAADELVAASHTVKGMDELQRRVQEVSATLPQMGRIMESIADIKDGNGLNLREAMDVLRSHYRAENH